MAKIRAKKAPSLNAELIRLQKRCAELELDNARLKNEAQDALSSRVTDRLAMMELCGIARSVHNVIKELFDSILQRELSSDEMANIEAFATREDSMVKAFRAKLPTFGRKIFQGSQEQFDQWKESANVDAPQPTGYEQMKEQASEPPIDFGKEQASAVSSTIEQASKPAVSSTKPPAISNIDFGKAMLDAANIDPFPNPKTTAINPFQAKPTTAPFTTTGIQFGRTSSFMDQARPFAFPRAQQKPRTQEERDLDKSTMDKLNTITPSTQLQASAAAPATTSAPLFPSARAISPTQPLPGQDQESDSTELEEDPIAESDKAYAPEKSEASDAAIE